MGLRGSKKPENVYYNLNGLYPTCGWDARKIKKMVGDKKIAPLYPGKEEKTNREMDECPICFLYYPGGLNRLKCCNQEMCSECYLQIRQPCDLCQACPYCNQEKFVVIFRGPKSETERKKEEEEQRKVQELLKKKQQSDLAQEKKKQRKKKKQKQKQKRSTRDKGKQKVSAKKTDKGNDDETNTKNSFAKAKPSTPTPDDTNHADQEAPKAKPSAADFVSFGSSSSDSSNAQEEGATNPAIAPAENDLEEMMIHEAIRLSLLQDSPNS